MAQKLRLKIKGLYTHPNPLSEVPAGALAVATNLVIDRESIAESRRGFSQYGDIVADMYKLMVYRDTLLMHAGTALYKDSDNAGTWVVYSGTFSVPFAPIQMQSVELNKSFFFTSNLGVYRLDSIAGTPVRSGVARALDVSGVLAGASGFMATATSVAYRIVWGYRDANLQLILGAPSARFVIGNATGGSRDVTLTFTVPSGLTTTYFYQIYRSEQTTSATAEPSDELQLVIESPLTAGQIAAGTVTLTDSTTDDQKGAFLYTSASQEGILQENSRPPIAADICAFKQHVFYGNTIQPFRLTIGFAINATIGNTVTLAGTVYTAAAAENIGANAFLVDTTIEGTMRSLIRVINRSASNTLVYAYELDLKNFFIETRALPGASFSITSNNAALFNKTVPLTADNDAKVNRVYISKISQPDAVPYLQYLDCGSGTKSILRILSVRDAVFVLKEDGIFRITGTDTANFVQEAHDNTTRIVGPNTAVALDNAVFFMSESGVCAVALAGINDQVGRPIETTLLQLSKLTNFESLAWAVNYDSDRKFILAVPANDEDTHATLQFVYNYETQSWTDWNLAIVTGIVNTRNDQLYVARATDDQVLQERKVFTLDDYADDEFAVTITGFTTDTVTLASVADVVVGMSIRQDDSIGLILEINGLVLTLDNENQPWANGAAIVYTPIMNALEWTEEDADNPGILKHYSEITFMFEDARFNSITFLTSSNFSQGFESVDLSAVDSGAWGEFPWGDEPWGGGFGSFQTIRTYFPREVARASWVNMRLELAQAFTAFSLAGASIIIEPMSPRFK